MISKPKILMVEDDDFAAIVAAEVLSPDYDLKHVSTGEAALEAVQSQIPDLVLLDVEMSGISGYEVCRIMREDGAIGDLPILFLSGRVNNEDRLAGYEAGGDDYLTKPVSAEELCAKIKRELAAHAERRRLKTDLSGAFSIAMTAMTSAAEIGAVLQFLRTSFGCETYASLCREILNTLAAYGLEADVQVRGKQGSVSLGVNGPCSPLEETVLTTMSSHGRLFEFGSRISCNFEHITIIVKSIDLEDPERHGRMKDNLALLAEGANARVVSLDAASVMASQHAMLGQLTARTRKTLESIERRQVHQGIRSSQIFQELQRDFERRVLTLGISHSQEEELSEMLQRAADQAQALFHDGLEIGADLAEILTEFDQAGI